MYRNKMEISEVRADTKVDLYTHHRYDRDHANSDYPTTVVVSALKDCGCDGPWLGNVVAVPYKEWTAEMRKARQEAKVSAKIWYIYPTNSTSYNLRKQPVGWALGKKQAANQLRDWHAKRNIARHNRAVMELVAS